MCQMASRFWFVCHLSSAGHSSFCLGSGDSGVSLDIQRGVDFKFQHSHVAVDTSSRNFGISTTAPVSNHDPDGKELSSRAVISSTSTASASARGGPKCDGCQKTADCFPSLSISKLCLKAVISYLVQQKVPETLVSEIVRPSPEAAQLLSVSAPMAAAATRVRVDPSLPHTPLHPLPPSPAPPFTLTFLHPDPPSPGPPPPGPPFTDPSPTPQQPLNTPSATPSATLQRPLAFRGSRNSSSGQAAQLAQKTVNNRQL